jgi:hypothetical protein
MDACDGMDAGGLDCGGLDGFDGPDFDGIDTIDLLNGAEHAGVNADRINQRLTGFGVSEVGDTVAVRILNHRSVSLFDIFRSAAESVGLLKVASILVGQRGFEPERKRAILPTLAAVGGQGSMPRGYADGVTGTTTMFRQYFQIPKREWGWLSEPAYDKEAGAYLDVSGMTWDYERSACESQLLVRVVALSSLGRGVWGTKTDKVEAHRKAARKVGSEVNGKLSHFAVSPAMAPVRRRQESRPVNTGAGLLAALVGSPQFGAMQTLTASVPALPTDESRHATAEGIEMVNLRMRLPRRVVV